MNAKASWSAVEVNVAEASGLGGRTRVNGAVALVVVDLQRGFTDPRHPLGVDRPDLIHNVNVLLDAAFAADAAVFFTVISYDHGASIRWFDKMPHLASFTHGSEWTEIDDRLVRDENYVVVVKEQASAVFGTSLVPQLRSREVDTVVVAGATTSGCIRATAVDLLSSGFGVVVPRDAVGDRIESAHHASLLDIDAKYGDVVTTAAAVALFDAAKRSAVR